MAAALTLCYSVLAYLFFVATFVYTIAFIGDFGMARSIDGAATAGVARSAGLDLALLALFALQHSVMARRGFKRWWTRIIPPAAERATFVLASTLALALLLWQWRPIPEPLVWSVDGAAGRAILSVAFWSGWSILLLSTFLIDHFELFGLAQPIAALRGRSMAEPQFRTPLLYRYVRHPLYVGFLLGFWATPVMTAGHFLFAAGATGYILVGIAFEERDLIAQFGDRYRAYRREVGMIVPWRKPGRS